MTLDADRILVETATGVIEFDALPTGTAPPTAPELAAWFSAGECPADALQEASARFKALLLWSPSGIWPYSWPPVQITVMDPSGRLLLGSEGLPLLIQTSIKEIYADWQAKKELEEAAKRRYLHDVEIASQPVPPVNIKDRTLVDGWPTELLLTEPLPLPSYPLTPLVRAWLRRPRLVEVAQPNHRRVFPGTAVHAHEGDAPVPEIHASMPQAPGATAYLPLPGLAKSEEPCAAIPLELWRIGGGSETNPGRGWPMALRLFVAGLLHSKIADRHGRHIIDLALTLRDVRKLLYPKSRPPGNRQFWDQFQRAVDTIRVHRGIPVWRPDTGTWAMRQILTIPEIPAGPTELDGPVIFRLDLPPGSDKGPMVARDLLSWAARDAPAARLLLNLAIYWNKPGVSLRPVGKRVNGQGRMFHQSSNPSDYDTISIQELGARAYPGSAIRHQAEVWHRTRKKLDDLERGGAVGEVLEVRRNEFKILPPRDYRNSKV